MVKVAIIGAGPRGLWAAQELVGALCDRAQHTQHTESTTAHEIVLFDPYSPGSGAVYRRDQPRMWRLNVRSDVVNAGALSLDQWRLRHGETEPLDPFPPRAVVGTYLEDCWNDLCATVSRENSDPTTHCTITLAHRRQFVSSVSRDGAGFRIPGEGNGATCGEYFDAVLATTGHPHDYDGALIHSPRAQDAPPVTPLYWDAELPASPQVIGVRGAALSFIDLCLYYGDSARQAHGHGTLRILPVNRGGRLMEVKPAPDIPVPDLSSFHSDIHQAQSTAEVEEVLLQAAQSLHPVSASGSPATDADLRSVLAGTDFHGDAVSELRTSLDVATGTRPHTAASAVGTAFRELYQQLVDDMVERGGPLPDFFPLARRLERVAFGSPPVTAQVLLELIDEGIVDTRFLGHPEAIDAWLQGQAYHGVLPDLIVDATIAPQGIPHIFPNLEGSPMFYASGRMNEHTVVGHDSLKRTVYRDIPRWAERIAAYAD